VVGRRAPLSLVEALLPPNQEMMSQDDHRHVMVPAAPETECVVIHPNLPFAFGKTGLDWPAHPADPRTVPREIVPVGMILHLFSETLPA
jgi:hypothetical protein